MGSLARGPSIWMACATTSLPTPLSPNSSTGTSKGAILTICSFSRATGSLSPMIASRPRFGRSILDSSRL
ncbi:hypothetical protein G6F35_018488 [Rhizopus arrhizus]|nr:hypothetical protein G6F35_018488 [Rhizopus arrhizus]